MKNVSCSRMCFSFISLEETMKCVCVRLFRRKEETGGNTNTSACMGGAYILGVADEKNNEKKIYSILAVIHLSLFIFQDLKEWRAKKKI